MKLLPIQWTNADAAASMNIASDQLNGNPNIAGFFSACAPTAVGACQAISAKGLEKKVNVPIEKKTVELAPVLITPENYKSPEVQKLLQTPEKFS
jgi:hypothetical protein